MNEGSVEWFDWFPGRGKDSAVSVAVFGTNFAASVDEAERTGMQQLFLVAELHAVLIESESSQSLTGKANASGDVGLFQGEGKIPIGVICRAEFLCVNLHSNVALEVLGQI